MYNIEAVTDVKEQAVAWEELNQPGKQVMMMMVVMNISLVDFL